MDERVLMLKLAGHWQKAARDVQNPTLCACYAKRAAQYLEMAAQRASSDKIGSILSGIPPLKKSSAN
jgi:hypothetical protein